MFRFAESELLTLCLEQGNYFREYGEQDERRTTGEEEELCKNLLETCWLENSLVIYVLVSPFFFWYCDVNVCQSLAYFAMTLWP